MFDVKRTMNSCHIAICCCLKACCCACSISRQETCTALDLPKGTHLHLTKCVQCVCTNQTSLHCGSHILIQTYVQLELPDLADDLAFAICLLVKEGYVAWQVAKPTQRQESPLCRNNTLNSSKILKQLYCNHLLTRHDLCKCVKQS